MPSWEEVFIGRQPVFDRNQNVYGYEMLFRSGDVNAAHLPSDECATSVVLSNLFGNFGFKGLVGEGKKAFVNFNERLILDENEPFFSPETVVIEVLEDVEVTSQLIEKIKHFKRKGYRIALDDYIFNPMLKPLEPLADLIKVDLPQVRLEEISEHIQRLKKQGVRLLAEKVETQKEFEACKQLGFDMFQGYFFAKPQVVKGKALPANHLTLLRLLSKVYDPKVNITTIVELVAQDVALSQKVLCVCGSLYPRIQVNSVHDAVNRFGIRRLQGWIATQVLTGMKHKPQELFKTALLRAKFCELMGRHLKGESKETYYTVGLLSVLDAIFDMTMQDVLKEMNLEPSVHDALTQCSGKMGQALLCAKAVESGELDFSGCADSNGHPTPVEVTKSYLEAMEYASHMMSL